MALSLAQASAASRAARKVLASESEPDAASRGRRGQRYGAVLSDQAGAGEPGVCLAPLARCQGEQTQRQPCVARDGRHLGHFRHQSAGPRRQSRPAAGHHVQDQ
ncbi:hypothetical protein OHA61_22405 [Streptomyces sp. NBC_00885]|uniref:hypothetical protein n=1 Tax=Streptomyces sp. NBC_00885 TaxID=2975857 RepID=UPI00386A3E9A|nr:hypothetical protein OHA61_22405 [Streptomyces sp. NBC_00885]